MSTQEWTSLKRLHDAHGNRAALLHRIAEERDAADVVDVLTSRFVEGRITSQVDALKEVAAEARRLEEALVHAKSHQVDVGPQEPAPEHADVPLADLEATVEVSRHSLEKWLLECEALAVKEAGLRVELAAAKHSASKGGNDGSAAEHLALQKEILALEDQCASLRSLLAVPLL